MKQPLAFATRAVVAGSVILLPGYLAVLLLLMVAESVAALVRPVSLLLPDWIRAERALALLLVLVICFLVGLAVRTRIGKAAAERIEGAFFAKLPGYALVQSLTRRLAGESVDNVWKPAFFEMDEGLLPAFIIEEFEDGRYTLFVPSIPTPLVGAVYIVDRSRVHPLNVPFTEALKTFTRWGAGSKNLIAGMETKGDETGAGPAPEARGA